MSNLGPQPQNTSFDGLLQIPGGITSTLQTVQDGNGNPTALSISTTAVSGLSVVAGSATNLVGGNAGELPYQTGPGATSFLGAGTAFQLLQSNGTSAPSWTSFPRGRAFRFDGAVSGQVTFAAPPTPANQIYNLPAAYPSTSGQVLSSTTAGTMSWVSGSADGATQVDSIAALKALPSSLNQFAYVKGYYAPGDGGGGNYFYDSADTTSADNGGTIIVATDGARWKLSTQGVISVKQFGARASATSDDRQFIQNAIDAAKALTGAATIFFPAGTYYVNGTINVVGDPANRNYWGIQLVGEGQWATRILQTNPTGITVLFDMIGGVGLSKMYLGYSVTATAGASIKIQGQSGFINLTEFTIEKSHTGILIAGTKNYPISVAANVAIYMDNFNIFDCIQNSVAIYNSNDIFMSNFIMSCPANSASYAVLGHIRLYDQTQAITLVNGDLIGGNYSMTADADFYTSSFIPERNAICNVYFDSTVNGVVFAKAQEFDFVNCWFATTSNAAGATLQRTQAMRFTNCKFYNCGRAGIQVTANSSYVILTSCDFQSNSKSSAGTYAGCQFDGSGTNNFQVLGCTGNNELFGGLQAAALFIGGGSDKFIVSNNNFNGTTGGGIINSSGTGPTKIVSNNLG
jgi:hypothetical protein